MVEAIDGVFGDDEQGDPFSLQASSRMTDGVYGVHAHAGAQRDPFKPSMVNTCEEVQVSAGFAFGDVRGPGGMPVSKLLNSSRPPQHMSQWKNKIFQQSGYHDHSQSPRYGG